MDGETYSPAELAGRWKCSKKMIYKMIETRRIRVLRVGHLVRIPADAVTEYEGQNTSAAV